MDLLSARLSAWEEDLRKAHTEISDTARSDPQKAGHKAEGIWVKVAQQILPPGYRVLTRKYMGTEVDVVILPPSAPAFYDDASVLEIPPDVASAVIHVKNTLNKEELRDAMKRIHLANSDQRHYRSTEAREREGLPSAIVALGSEWKGGFTSAHSAFGEILGKEFVPSHPSQIPSFVGTPEWDMHNRTINMSPLPEPYQLEYQKNDPRWTVRHVVKLICGTPSGLPIHAFAEWLYTACAASDPTLEPMRVTLTQMFELSGTSSIWPFEAAAVYSNSRLGT